MFDTSIALADMARQIRECRAGEGLTLQQLALRSGVAASTIHKVESRQMVPTVSVLLKIARGLGRRADELIRDPISTEAPEASKRSGGGGEGAPLPGSVSTASSVSSEPGRAGAPRSNSAPRTERDVGVWNLELSEGRCFPRLELDTHQRAYVLVEQGCLRLRVGIKEIQMAAGDCLEVEGGCIEATCELQAADASPSAPGARVVLIVSPPGNFAQQLGARRNANPYTHTAAVA